MESQESRMHSLNHLSTTCRPIKILFVIGMPARGSCFFPLCLTCKHSGAKYVPIFETILIITPHLNLGTRILYWWVQTREKYVSAHGHWFMAMKIYLIQPAKWSPEASNQENEIPAWVLPALVSFNSMPLPHSYRAWSLGDSRCVNANLAWRCWPWKYWDFAAQFSFLNDFKLLVAAQLMSLGFIWLLAWRCYLKRAVPYAAHAYSMV